MKWDWSSTNATGTDRAVCKVSSLRDCAKRVQYGMPMMSPPHSICSPIEQRHNLAGKSRRDDTLLTVDAIYGQDERHSFAGKSRRVDTIFPRYIPETIPDLSIQLSGTPETISDLSIRLSGTPETIPDHLVQLSGTSETILEPSVRLSGTPETIPDISARLSGIYYCRYYIKIFQK